MEQILHCKYDFKGRRWQKVSDQAKAFVKTLLVDDPDERASAEEAASSTWLNRGHAATIRGPTEEELEATMMAMNTFSHYRQLKKLALMVIAHKSTSEEVGILRKIFEKYDTSKNGVITFDEFAAALQSYGFSDDELERMYDGCVSLICSVSLCPVLAFASAHEFSGSIGCRRNGGNKVYRVPCRNY